MKSCYFVQIDLKTTSINIEKFLVCFPLFYMDCYMYPESKVREWMHFKGPRHPMTFTFYDSMSQHGDLNPFWT